VLSPNPRFAGPIDPDAVSPSAPHRAWKQLGLLLLCTAWIALGLGGHDPWKTEDAVTFSIASSMQQRGDVVAPTLVGETRFEHGMLVPAMAAMTETLFSPPLAPHNAARLAVGILLVFILLLTSMATRELDGVAFRWLPVLILIGSVGFFDRAHALSADLGATLGVAVALYGFALALRRPIGGGIVIGLGAAAGFLAKGFEVPLWTAVTCVILPLAGSTWRSKTFAVTVVIAAATAALIGGLWPFAMYMRDARLFGDWRDAETLSRYFGWRGNPGDFDPLYSVKNLLWFAWPASPLVLWTLWIRARGFNGGLARPGVQLPVVFSLVILAGVMSMSNPTLIVMLPLLVPMAALASLEVDTLKRGFSGALDWFGILTFGLIATLLWWLWIDAYINSMSAPVARFFRDTEFGYRPTFKLWETLVALFLTLLWIALVRPARKSNRRALLNWAAGVVLLWGLYSTIWLPYLDSRRSYRSVATELTRYLPVEGCVASRNLGDPQRALLNYFNGLTTLREGTPGADKCNALLVQYSHQTPEPIKGWHSVWEGARRGDDTERFVLYMRDNP
jgi:4-amino-4-deoxy-L-arabinose transferase-like glycosyltransferase